MVNHNKYLKEKRKNKNFELDFLFEKKMAELAVKIQEERIKIGISQQELAKKAHVTQQQLSSIEHGSNYTVKTLFKICSALGLEKIELSF
jgi:HTH-type transcriptional regulator / antitoxin HipB